MAFIVGFRTSGTLEMTGVYQPAEQDTGLEQEWCDPQQTNELRGIKAFTSLGQYGSVGRTGLTPLAQRQYSDQPPWQLSSRLWRGLQFLKMLDTMMPPKDAFLWKPWIPPLVVASKGRVDKAMGTVPAKVMVLALALSSCLEGAAGQSDAVAAVDPAPLPRVAGQVGSSNRFGIGFKMVMVLWLLTIVCTVWCTCKVAKWVRSIAGTRSMAPKTCDKSVQSQVTYKWWHATPRFVPLPEYSHGGWQV